MIALDYVIIMMMIGGCLISGFFIGMIIEISMFSVFLVLMYIIIIKKKYPVKVQILEKRAGGYTISYDVAGRTGKTGEVFYRLRSKGKNIKPSAFDYIFQTNKGLWIILYSPGPDEFYPTKISDRNPDNVKINPIDEDMKFWLAHEYQLAYQRAASRSVIEKYMPIMLLAIFTVCIMLILYALPNYSSMVAEPWHQVADSMAQTTEAMKGSSTMLAP